MEFKYLKYSLKSLLPIIIIPLIILLLYLFLIEPQYMEFKSISEKSSFNTEWIDFRISYILGTGFILSLLFNVLFVYIIPALTSIGPDVKHRQFIIFFIISLIFSMFFPVLTFILYGLDTTSLAILLALYIALYSVSFVVSSRFVSSTYVSKFWFK